jgi:hypothetical protein
MAEFKDIMDDMPGWQELERRVEMAREDGTVVAGKVTYTEMTPGPDEWPILEIEVDGARLSWFDFAKWRYPD